MKIEDIFWGVAFILWQPNVTEFVTTGGTNDKTIKIESGSWQYIDNTDGTKKPFVYVGQDVDYYYFDDPADPSRHYRISMFGGPMQRDSGSGWQSLYLTSSAS
jgi:hypothetical protein